MCEGPHPYIPATNVTKAELVYTQLGEVVENVLHFSTISPLSGDELLQLGGEIRAAWEANIRPLISVSASLFKIRLTDLTTEIGPSVEYTTGLPLAGSESNPVTNGAQTVTTKFTTAGRGRSRRGRLYNVGMPDSFATNNQISAANAALYTAAWNGFREDMLLASLSAIQVIVSYCGDKTWRTEALITAVTGASTEVFLDSQRRRLHNRGQ